MWTLSALLPPLLLASFLPFYCEAAPSPPCDNTTHIDCQVRTLHRCIPMEWMCDNIRDCDNGLDEARCSYLHECPIGTFICRDGSCIDQSMKCNGEADCYGGMDEVACHGEDVSHLRHTPSVPEVVASEAAALRSPFGTFTFNFDVFECLPPKFQCKNGGPCLVLSAVCDGEKDCPLGEDELNCTLPSSSSSSANINSTRLAEPLICTGNRMMCADELMCVPINWVCDGEPDCDDGSDEQDCEDELTLDAQSNHHLCTQDEFRCAGSTGSCIQFNKTCDGVRDCPDGDDEGDACSECHRLPCHHKCHISPSGPRCYCPPGARLGDDGLSCSDIDECQTEEGKHCQHYCENLNNRYHCKCAPGYVLGLDSHSCRIDRDHEGMIFQSLGTEIRSMPLFDPQSSHDVYSVAQTLGSHGMVRSIDFLHSKQMLFLSVVRLAHEGELAISHKGEIRVLRENLAGIGPIAVDWIGKNIFITQKYPSARPGISVCSLNGFYCKMLIRGQDADESNAAKRQSYRGLALFPLRGQMVWIEEFNGRNKIMMADMDGSNMRTLVENKLEYPSGLAIDPIRGDVYFGDVGREMIEKINIESLERHIVLTSGVHHPHDLVYFNGFIYWSDWGSQSLKVSEMSRHHSSAHIIHSFTRFPYGIAVNHTMYQPTPTRDPCSSISCQWMCVAVPDRDGRLNPQCICPDNYRPDLDACIHVPHSEDSESSFVGVALMKELCAVGEGCLNGGVCEEQSNLHGRVEKITCACAFPYSGEHCEHRDEAAEQVAELLSGGYGPWAVVFYTILFLIILVTLFFAAYQRMDSISQVTKSTMDRMGDIHTPRVVTTLLEGVSERVNNFRRSAATPGLATPQFENPLYSNVPGDSETSPGGSRISPPNSLATDSVTLPSVFENPLYPSSSGTAPFSGYEVTYNNKFTH